MASAAILILSKVGYTELVNLVWPISISVPNLANTFIYDRGKAKNRKFKMAAASGILGYSNPCVSNIYQCTKFEVNIFIYDRDTAKNRKFKIAATAVLSF